jgi:GxxExxY protein
MGEYLYKDLTQQIIGCAFRVFKELGYGYREKVYQRGLAEEFGCLNLSFKKELPVRIYYKNKLIAKYYLDFIIENKVVVELKVAADFYTKDIKQLLSYLKANNCRLGLLLIVTKRGIKCKRVIN